LIVKKEGGRFYDRFRGRVIFPIHNLSGKVIAFGARILTKEKDQPKYINSPETDIYHKSHVLYGMYQAKNAIRREDFCYIVEGYTDVISLHQADIDNVVSSSGTAFTEEQIKLIRRFTENITVLFDGDAAGIKAALRGIDLVLKGGLNVRVVLLPDGDDPDSISRKMGSAELKQFLKEKSKDFISFKIDLLASESAQDPIKKAEAIREIVTSISLIPDPIKRSVYIQETGQLLKIQETVLLSELNKILIAERHKPAPAPDKRDAQPISIQEVEAQVPQSASWEIAQIVDRQERESIRLLLNYAEQNFDDKRLLDFMLAELEDVEFTNPVFKEIYEHFRAGAERGEIIDPLYFMEHGTQEVKNMVAELTTVRYHASKYWSEEYFIFFPTEQEILHDAAYSNVLRLKFRMIQKLIDDNLESLKTAKSEEEMDHFFTIHEQLKGAEKELADTLGIVIAK
jgi:DNA primase